MTERQLCPIDQNLPALLRRLAKRASKEDKSLSYQQHLNVLAKRYGFTYESLLDHLEKLEQAEIDVTEAKIWADRFQKGSVWGGLPNDDGEFHMPLPIAGPSQYPMPNALLGLFRCGEGRREQYSGWIPSFGEPTTHYEGEELRISSDDAIFSGLVMGSREKCIGEVISLSLENFEAGMGCRLEDLGMPVSPAEIARTLWRLTHSVVSVPSVGFDGPLIKYADTSHAPGIFHYRFNPEIARLYYNPNVFALFARMRNDT